MGDKIPDAPRPLTKEEKVEREFRQIKKEKLIARTRAAVVRSQLVKAYEILENIRFDFVSDTAFREKIVHAKHSIESAIDDFLMSDKYWEDRVDYFGKMTLEMYKEFIKQPAGKPTQKGEAAKKTLA